MMRLGQSAPLRSLTLGWLMGISLLFSFGRLNAQSLRDPTLAPVEAGLSSTAPGAKPLTAESGAMAVIVRDGRPFLVVGTRLYAVGQKLGQARIERISETEVWLREGGVLRKISQFPGILRRTVTSPSKASAPVAPRADVQPWGPSNDYKKPTP
jgi:hypothetical protein